MSRIVATMGGACSRKRDQSEQETDDGQGSRSGRLSRSISLRWPVKASKGVESLASQGSGAHGARTPPSLLEISVRQIVKVDLLDCVVFEIELIEKNFRVYRCGSSLGNVGCSN